MNTRTLRRARRQAASTGDDVIEGIEEAARTLGKMVDKASGKVGAEIGALPEQLEGLRHAVVTAAEPHRPPKRYRPHVRLGVLVMVVAAVIAMVMRHRQAAARSAATPPNETGNLGGPGDNRQAGPISSVPGTTPEYGGRQS